MQKCWTFLFSIAVLFSSVAFAVPDVHTEQFGPRSGLWRAAVEKSSSGRMHIQLQLPSGKNVHAVFAQDGRLEKFWFSGVAVIDQHLEPSDQDRMRFVLLTEAEQNFARAPELVLFIDFVTNFLPANELIAPFDVHEMPTEWLSTKYTMICDSIGKRRSAYFTSDRGGLLESAIVGVPESRCRGRCGGGCDPKAQVRGNQYTQECLAHDLCRTNTGQNMGVCADEFWLAASGYVLAPNCPAQ